VLQSRIVYALVSHENEASSGRAFVEVGIVLWRGPDRVVAADAAFVCAASLPVKETAEGYLETIPDLVVEIRSKNDTPDALDRKADDYLRAGVRLVWIVDDDAKCVTARDHASAKTFGAGDTLTAGEIIPGFQVAVDEILRP
jgi:Uma2 family endonuclease